MGRKLFQILKSKSGMAVLFIAFLLVVYFILKSTGAKPVSAGKGKSGIYVQKTPEVKIEDDIPGLKNSPSIAKPPVIIKKKFRKEIKKRQRKLILPIDLYTAKPSKNDINPENYAPFGRLVKCELVITIDSSRIDTPIIAMVIEDLVHNGVVIIPAGTELHGTASTGNMRDRIASNGNWVFVWRTRDGNNGLELKIKGMALDMEESVNRGQWAITDGSAGLRGRVIDTTEWSTLMAIAATFISGVGEGMAQRIYTTDGNFTEQSYGGTFKDAFGKGMERAANVYAQQMLKTITRDGVFVRVPAGKQFYLYIQDTVNLDNAEIGGTKIKISNVIKTKRSFKLAGRRR
jgi:type F conjugative transfer system protein TrbI